MRQLVLLITCVCAQDLVANKAAREKKSAGRDVEYKKAKIRVRASGLCGWVSCMNACARAGALRACAAFDPLV